MLHMQVHVPHGLREREAQPYHMQPAAPERFSLGRRPCASVTPPPQPDSPAQSAQYSYAGEDYDSGDYDSEDYETTAEQRAQEALQEAERMREWCTLLRQGLACCNADAAIDGTLFWDNMLLHSAL